MDVSVRRHMRRKPETAIRRAGLTKLAEERVRKGDMARKRKFQLAGRRESAIVFRSMRGDELMDVRLGPKVSMRVLNEKIADSLDNLLGWDVVPPTELRIVVSPKVAMPPVPGKEHGTEMPIAPDIGVSMQQWVTAQEWDAANPEARNAAKTSHREEFFKVFMMDIVLGQTDRHGGNLMVEDNGKVWSIDNERMLWHDMGNVEQTVLTAGIYAIDSAATDFYGVGIVGERMPENLRRDLRELDKGDFHAALAGQPNWVIEAAWTRKELLDTFDHLPDKEEWRRAVAKRYGHEVRGGVAF